MDSARHASLFGAQRNAPRGVFKYRPIEEANAHREAWERIPRRKPDKLCEREEDHGEI